MIKDDNKEVADILIDLIRRETHNFSMRFARSLVGELSTSVGLINNPHRSAGFKVLKAPDVPSVLVELGYLSNAKDEAQLLDADWRGKAAAEHRQRRRAVCLRQDRNGNRRLTMVAAAHNRRQRCTTTTARRFYFRIANAETGRCRILPTWRRHGFSITDRDRSEGLRGGGFV